MSRAVSPGHTRRGPAQGMNSGGMGGPTYRQKPGGPTLNARPPSSSSSSRVQSPAPAVPVPPRDVSKLLGAKLKLTLAGPAGSQDRVVEGDMWCYDPLSGVVVLETPSKNQSGGKAKQDYRMVKVNTIKSLDVLSVAPFPSSSNANAQPIDGPIATKTALDAILAPLQPVSVAGVAYREAAAVKNDIARKARLGVGVTRWAQEMYDALAKTLPVRWHNTSIIILDEVMLSAPHRPQDAKARSGSQQPLERVRQVLEGERQRLVKTKEGQEWESAAIKAASSS